MNDLKGLKLLSTRVQEKFVKELYIKLQEIIEEFVYIRSLNSKSRYLFYLYPDMIYRHSTIRFIFLHFTILRNSLGNGVDFSSCI